RWGLLSRTKNALHLWKYRWIERTVNEPLDDRVNNRVPDWLHTHKGRALLGVAVVAMIAYCTVALIALMNSHTNNLALSELVMKQEIQLDQEHDMLEGFDIPGLGTLNAVAAFFLGTAILVMILGLGYGMTLFVSGKTGGGSQRTTKGLQTSGLALVGAAVLGSIGGMIHWSMDQGDSELMPVAAQPQEIITDKEPASVSCSAVTRDFTDEIEDLMDSGEPDHDMNDEHIQWAVELVGEEYEYEV